MLTETQERLLEERWSKKGLRRWEKDRFERKLDYFRDFRGAKLLSHEPFTPLGKRAKHPAYAAQQAIKDLAKENSLEMNVAVYCYLLLGVRAPGWAGHKLCNVTSPAARRVLSHWAGRDTHTEDAEVMKAFDEHIGGAAACARYAASLRAERSPLTRLETQWVAVVELCAHERRLDLMYAVGVIEHNWRASVWRRRVLFNPATMAGKIFFAAGLAAAANEPTVDPMFHL
jgi:hypothetical protein